MKLLLMGSLLFSGGSAVAMQNETINEEVTQAYQQVKVMIQNRLGNNVFETIKETGAYPYPSETQLAQLTDEQEAILVSTIDQINAEYDWANMTDEEIQAALADIKVEMDALRAELGIEAVQTQSRQGNHWNEDFVRGGKGTQSGSADGTGDCPYDEPVDDTVDDTVDGDIA